MGEKDISGIIIPPKYSLPVTSSQTEPKFINVTISPSNTIIYSCTENKAQFVITAQTYHEAIKNGEPMSLHDIPKATSSTGDIAVEVKGISFTEILRGNKSGIISNDLGTFVWEGNTSVMITSIDSPANPVTGERLIPPTGAKILQFPQPQITTIEQPAAISASHIGSGNTVSLGDAVPDNLRQFVVPLRDGDLNKAA